MKRLFKKKLFAGIEAGGTKFVCAIGDANGEIVERKTITTLTPDETLPEVIKFFEDKKVQGTIVAAGIGSFGPIDADKNSPTYGHITATPKPGWTDFNIVGAIQTELNMPVGFETDVASAARGEMTWGEGQDLKNSLYITVGTGIGAASMINGEILPGLCFQEMGHILIPQDKKQDDFKGICPYHNNCLEGLASGVAIKERWHVESALDLPADHPAWELEADYLATALMTYLLTLSPEKIIMGGGVMKQAHLFPKIRTKLVEKLNGYVQNTVLENLDNFIVPPGLSERSGIAGAIALAKLISKSSQ